MTDGELANYKEKIKKVMVDHLASISPNLSPERVMQELNPMWVKIEEAGLKLPGMTYQGFCEQANSQFLIDSVKRMMGI